MDDESIPLSQLANEAFNPTAPRDLSNDGGAARAAGPTDFSGLAAHLACNGTGAGGAGPGPGSAAVGAAGEARLGKSGKLFQARRPRRLRKRWPCTALPCMAGVA